MMPQKARTHNVKIRILRIISWLTHILFLITSYLARAERMSMLLIPSRGSLLITLQHKMLLNLNKIRAK